MITAPSVAAQTLWHSAFPGSTPLPFERRSEQWKELGSDAKAQFEAEAAADVERYAAEWFTPSHHGGSPPS